MAELTTEEQGAAVELMPAAGGEWSGDGIRRLLDDMSRKAHQRADSTSACVVVLRTYIKNADAELARLRTELAEAQREILHWKRQSFRPLGDNHHNAKLCPHCNPPGSPSPGEDTTPGGAE